MEIRSFKSLNWKKARISILTILMIIFIWQIIPYKETLNFNNTVVHAVPWIWARLSTSYTVSNRGSFVVKNSSILKWQKSRKQDRLGKPWWKVWSCSNTFIHVEISIMFKTCFIISSIHMHKLNAGFVLIRGYKELILVRSNLVV